MEYQLSDNTWDEHEQEAIKRVIRSDRFSMGEEVKMYEHEFARKVGSKYAVMSNSGSSANLLAVAALVYSKRLAPGDEVIVPAVSWSTSYFPFCQHNLKLKFVDIDKTTLNSDIGQIEAAISPRTRAILAVNLLGNPNDYGKLLEVCQKNNLILIEDNCEALGGRYAGRELGTFGILGTFSTFYSHHISTMEGGVTVTDDEELYHYLLSIRSHGWTRNQPENSKLYQKTDDAFYESFNFIVPGYNLRPLEMEAAIGLAQLKKRDAIIQQRIKNAAYFLERIGKIKNIRTQKEIGQSSWFGFAMVLEGDYQGRRNDVVTTLQQNAIEVRPIVAGNFTRSRAIQFMDYTIHGNLEQADDIHQHGFFVGNHSHDNSDKIDYLLDVLEKELR